MEDITKKPSSEDITETLSFDDILDIPDSDLVYMRIHKINIDTSIDDPKESIRPVAFDPRGDGLSVDWSAYSTPQKTKDRAKIPADNGVISMPIDKIREIPLLEVKHTPDALRNNYSHAEIMGILPRKPSDMGIRVKLMDMCKWEIPLAI